MQTKIEKMNPRQKFPNNTNIVYLNERGIFFKADCLDLLTGIKSNSVDLIFTDPPFNLKKDYGTDQYNDSMASDAYRKWCQTWLFELIRVLKPGGALTIYQWPKLLIELGAWLNQIPILRYRSLISLKMKSGFPIKGRLHPANYGILYYVKKGAKPTFNVARHKTPICRHCGKEIRDYGGYRKKFVKFEDNEGVPWIQISDFWEDTRPARQDKSRKLRINELPIHIPERIILMASKEDDVVLDIFGGGGSTYHAAQMHNRNWIGCEIGDITATLSRFATVWGRKEKETPNSKVANCFNEEYLGHFAEKRKKKRYYPIKNVKLLANGKRLSAEDWFSKSKVIGY